MRKLLTTTAVALALIAGNAHSDQATLDAIEANGVNLKAKQIAQFPKEACVMPETQGINDEMPAGCQALVDGVVKLLAEYQDDAATSEKITEAFTAAHPELIADFLVALEGEIGATAAGTPPGIARALAVANPNNNIPTTPGGGGVSSPN